MYGASFRKDMVFVATSLDTCMCVLVGADHPSMVTNIIITGCERYVYMQLSRLCALYSGIPTYIGNLSLFTLAYFMMTHPLPIAGKL